MSYERNVYYNPHTWDLEIIAEIDPEEAYQFDSTIVWKHKDGTFYWAHDCGCSCPTPFQDFESLDDLEVLTFDTFKKLKLFVEDRYKCDHGPDPVPFLHKVFMAITKKEV